MALLELRDIRLAFGGPDLLSGVTLRLESSDRVCLLGRNGSGKTSLLNIVAGLHKPDAGERVLARGASVALLPQDVPGGLAGPVRNVVRELGHGTADWQGEIDVDRMLAVMRLDRDAETANLSAGQKRRVLLAAALSSRPDLLLLDEPTNHLDLPSIAWLEEYLARRRGALVFVTHDRAFLRRFARRIVELDRGRLLDWTCSYDTWLERKDALLEAEETGERAADRHLESEEQWLRRGIKARRTRNEGRVRRLEELRRRRAECRAREGDVRLRANMQGRSGNLVAAVRGLSLQRDGRVLFCGLDWTAMRGDRIGIIGPNGAGKTSFLQVLFGELPPSSGTVELGVNLKPAYFDQLRAALDPDRSVRWNVAEGLETLTIDGRPRHVIGYLSDFLFTPQRAAQPVRSLSGGERNRLLLARLFARPANVLVLDEPTNDLDLETLELLEELLIDYPGTVLLVSHDRQFLDNTVTSTLAFDGCGGVREFVGGYTDWERQSGGWISDRGLEPGRMVDRADRGQSRKESPQPAGSRADAAQRSGSGGDDAPRKLRWREARELEALPAVIEELEREQAELYAQLSDPAEYRAGGDRIAAAQARLQQIGVEREIAYARWQELEHRAGAG